MNQTPNRISTSPSKGYQKSTYGQRYMNYVYIKFPRAKQYLYKDDPRSYMGRIALYCKDRKYRILGYYGKAENDDGLFKNPDGTVRQIADILKQSEDYIRKNAMAFEGKNGLLEAKRTKRKLKHRDTNTKAEVWTQEAAPGERPSGRYIRKLDRDYFIGTLHRVVLETKKK